MAFYADKVVPRIVELACGARTITPWRQKVCEGLSGTVVEIGFGSGLNVPFYPSGVSVVYAVEPSALAMKLAHKRMKSAFVKVQHVGLDGKAIELGDASCDMALMTFTLCTVPHPDVALRELWRVLKPGGELHFLEHGLSPSRSVALFQRLLDPLQQRVADGCHLTRQPMSLIRDAGFETLWSQQGPAKGPKPWCYFDAGVVQKL